MDAPLALHAALGNAGERGQMPLPRLATDPHVLDDNGGPPDILADRSIGPPPGVQQAATLVAVGFPALSCTLPA